MTKQAMLPLAVETHAVRIPQGRDLRAISLTQPFASLVILLEKEYETRSWPTAVRGDVAIHAARNFPTWAQELCHTNPFFRDALARHGLTVATLPLGDILGLIEWQSCQPTEIVRLKLSEKELAFGDYDSGRYASRLANPRPCKQPIPARGSLGFWRVPAEIAALL